MFVYHGVHQLTGRRRSIDANRLGDPCVGEVKTLSILAQCNSTQAAVGDHCNDRPLIATIGETIGSLPLIALLLTTRSTRLTSKRREHSNGQHDLCAKQGRLTCCFFTTRILFLLSARPISSNIFGHRFYFPLQESKSLLLSWCRCRDPVIIRFRHIFCHRADARNGYHVETGSIDMYQYPQSPDGQPCGSRSIMNGVWLAVTNIAIGSNVTVSNCGGLCLRSSFKPVRCDDDSGGLTCQLVGE